MLSKHPVNKTFFKKYILPLSPSFFNYYNESDRDCGWDRYWCEKSGHM